VVTFTYRKERGKITGVVYRPVAKIYIKSEEGEWIPFAPYIDSGADITLIPYTLGLKLGFEITKEIINLHGVRGIGLPVEIRRVKMRIGEIELEPKVAWALIEEAPPLLGRLDIFDKFNITFKEKEGVIIFEPAES